MTLVLNWFFAISDIVVNGVPMSGVISNQCFRDEVMVTTDGSSLSNSFDILAMPVRSGERYHILTLLLHVLRLVYLLSFKWEVRGSLELLTKTRL